MTYFTSAVILAAGKATRMTAVDNKQTAVLAGKTVIARTIEAFEMAKTIQQIVLVAGEETAAHVKTLNFKKLATIVPGGSCREESSRIGLQNADPRTEFVAIHDGARPFITSEEIDEAVLLAHRTRAVCCGTRPKDTVKQIDENGTVIQTPDRNLLFTAATPQIFRKKEILSAMEKEPDLSKFTDDCSIAEKHKIPVTTFLCSYQNIKITTNEDLLLAELLLSGEKQP